MILNGDETKGDVGGWVTIDNNSGKRYLQTKLKLIAGDVNTVSQQNTPQPMMMVMEMADAAPAAPPSFSSKAFSDFHLYTLSELVDIEDKSQKQVEFIPKVYGINIRKYNLISISAGGYSQQNIKAKNKFEFSNSKDNKLGMAMPKGVIRVFK